MSCVLFLVVLRRWSWWPWSSEHWLDLKVSVILQVVCVCVSACECRKQCWKNLPQVLFSVLLSCEKSTKCPDRITFFSLGLWCAPLCHVSRAFLCCIHPCVNHVGADTTLVRWVGLGRGLKKNKTEPYHSWWFLSGLSREETGLMACNCITSMNQKKK